MARSSEPTAPTSPTRNEVVPRTTALAANTRPRRGNAVNVVRIMPRRYSEVAKRTPTAIRASSPAMTPIRAASTMSSSGGFGPTLPEPVTV